MRTLHVEEKKENTKISLTEGAKHPEESPEVKTEKISFTKIMKSDKFVGSDGQVNNIDCTEDFSFEKSRIKAIEHTQLFASLSTTPINQDNVLCNQSLHNMLFEKQLGIDAEKDKLKKSKEMVTRILKIVSIVLTLFSTANVIGAFFGILYLSISNIPISDFVAWLSLEIVITIIFMYISIKGSNASDFAFLYVNSYLKWLLIYGICLIVVLVVICIQKNLTSAIACSMNISKPGIEYSDYIASILCIVLVSMFFSTLYKLAIIIIYVILSAILRKILMDMESLLQPQDNQCLPPSVNNNNENNMQPYEV